MNLYELQKKLKKKCDNIGFECDILTSELSIGIEKNQPYNLCKVKLSQKGNVIEFRSVASTSDSACKDAILKALKSFD